MITIRTTNRCYKQPPPRNLHRPTTKLQSATSRECQKNDESERQRLSRSFVQITKAATPVRVISPGFHENRTEAKNHRQGFCEFARKKRRKVSEKSANDRQTDRQTRVEMEGKKERKEGKGRDSVSRGGGCRDSCEPAFTIRNRSMEVAERETTGREKKKREEKGDEREKRERRAKER